MRVIVKWLTANSEQISKKEYRPFESSSPTKRIRKMLLHDKKNVQFPQAPPQSKSTSRLNKNFFKIDFSWLGFSLMGIFKIIRWGSCIKFVITEKSSQSDYSPFRWVISLKRLNINLSLTSLLLHSLPVKRRIICGTCKARQIIVLF